MKTVTAIILALLIIAPAAVGAGKTPAEDQSAQGQYPIEPARPTGFERRDMEQMDRRIEERRDQWRAEEAAKAEARKRARSPAEKGHAPDSASSDARADRKR